MSKNNEVLDCQDINKIKVLLKYNPYLVETNVYVNEIEVAENSELYKYKNERLQLWVDKLPELLVNETNSNNFDLSFYGTILDYNDVKEILLKQDNIKVDLSYIPCKEKENKFGEINDLIRYVEETHIEGINKEGILKNFEKAMNSELEIAVVATMSSGKSTLINSMLGRDLMPAKNEACTAKISRIKNVNGSKEVSVKAFDADNVLVKEISNATVEDLTYINEDSNISTIEIECNIPYINTDNMNLTLIDTPGPNNSQDESHKEHTYKVIKGYEGNPLILYIMNATQLNTNDDNHLLGTIANVMKEGGKQSKDRFIFVINKFDQFNPDDDDINKIINNTKSYLLKHGIENPNLFLTSASLAKLIRKDINGMPLTRSEKRELQYKLGLFIDEEFYHSLVCASLSDSTKEDISRTINKLKKDGDEIGEALYHSGIPYVEKAISEYLEKYAETLKITTSVEAVRRIINNNVNIKKIEEKIRNNEEERLKLHELMNKIHNEIQKGDKLEALKDDLENYNGEELYENKISKVEIRCLEQLDDMRERIGYGGKLDRNEARVLLKRLKIDVESLKADLLTEIESTIRGVRVEYVNKFVEQYKGYISSLTDVGMDSSIGNNIIEFMSDNVIDVENLIDSNTKSEMVEYEIKKERSIFNPKRWFGNKYYYETEYREEEYIDSDGLAEECISPITNLIYEVTNHAKKYINDSLYNLRESLLQEADKMKELLLQEVEKLSEISESEEALTQVIEREKEKRDFINELDIRLGKILEI